MSIWNNYKVFNKKSLFKLFSICALVFCIISNYVVVRNLKDGAVIRYISAESISFLKLFFVLPFSMLVVYFYNALHYMVNRLKVPYFIFFFLGTILFGLAFFVFPYNDVVESLSLDIHPTLFKCSYLKPINGLIVRICECLNKWHVVLFYITAEVFGTLCLNAIGWRLANEIFDVKESKVFYGFITVAASFGMIFGAGFLTYISTIFETDDSSFFIRIGAFIFGVTVATLLFYAMCMYSSREVLATREEAKVTNGATPTKKKKVGIIQSFRLVFSNPILFYMLFITIGYMVSINLVEITWKKSMSLKTATASKSYTVASYCKMSSGISTLTGLITITGSMFGNFVLNSFGWFSLAILSPVLAGCVGILFIAAYAYGKVLHLAAGTVFMIGTVHNVLAKTCKYSLSDLAREMSYKFLYAREKRLNLGHDASTFGKAGVEVIGGKMGKQLGSLIQVILLSVTASSDLAMKQEDIARYILIILCGFVILWIWSVFKLNTYIAQEEQAQNQQNARSTKE